MLFACGSWGYRWSNFYGTYFPNEIGRERVGAVLWFKETDVQPITFYVFVNSSSGSAFEMIRFEKDGENWRRSIAVAGGKQPRCVWMETGFPPITDKKEWPEQLWRTKYIKRSEYNLKLPCA
jgi:hypothetical protein